MLTLQVFRILVTLLMAALCQAASVIFNTHRVQCLGQTLYADPDYCTKYFECINETPVEHDCPSNQVFNDHLKVCVVAGSQYDKCTPEHVDRECERKTVAVIPNPTSCQGFYNCSSKRQQHSRLFSDYETECTYPDLFDIVQMKCVKFYYALCGEGRVAGKWECDYKVNLCGGSHCRPCWVNHPKCVGKKDGLWPVPWMLNTPYYVDCYDERSKHGLEMCPKVAGKQMLFDPDLRMCMTSTSNK